MDVIAGAVGFLPDLVSRHSNGEISFEKIRELGAELCPEASLQASLIGFAKSWPAPALLIQVGMGLRKREKASLAQESFGFAERPEPVLRALNITSNDAARETGFEIYRNMRVPESSVIHAVFSNGVGHLEAIENLSSGKQVTELRCLGKPFGSKQSVLAPILMLWSRLPTKHVMRVHGAPD